jgi:hypothetical protein
MNVAKPQEEMDWVADNLSGAVSEYGFRVQLTAMDWELDASSNSYDTWIRPNGTNLRIWKSDTVSVSKFVLTRSKVLLDIFSKVASGDLVLTCREFAALINNKTRPPIITSFDEDKVARICARGKQDYDIRLTPSKYPIPQLLLGTKDVCLIEHKADKGSRLSGNGFVEFHQPSPSKKDTDENDFWVDSGIMGGQGDCDYWVYAQVNESGYPISFIGGHTATWFKPVCLKWREFSGHDEQRDGSHPDCREIDGGQYNRTGYRPTGIPVPLSEFLTTTPDPSLLQWKFISKKFTQESW